MNDANENKRGARRAKVLKGAKIVSLNHSSIVDCVVRDISDTGAKIVCGDPIAIANTFRFMLPSDNSIRDARVVWRRDGMIGIEFTSPKSKAPARKI